MSTSSVPLNLSSPQFISFSCSAPLQTFKDTVNNVEWEFRQGGAIQLDEAVVIISDIYDSPNTMYIVMGCLIDAGYRVINICIPPYNGVSSFLTGFDLFTASKLISKVHLVGFGFGGYLAMSLCNFPALSAEILSVAIIAGYMSPGPFKHSGGLFSGLTGKSDLHGELYPTTYKFPADLKQAAAFAVKEMESVPASIVAARVRLRQGAPPTKPPNMTEPKRILIVQPVDWCFKMDNKDRPQKVIEGALYQKIEKGGHIPHLANPMKIVDLLKEFIGHWYTSNVEDEELDVEEEEDEN